MAIKTIQQLKEEITGLRNRLNGCSDCIVGRKRRKEIEGMIQRREQKFYQLVDKCAGCISNNCFDCQKEGI